MVAFHPKYVEHISDAKDQCIILKLAEKLQNFNFTDLFSSITFGPETSPEAARCVEEFLEKKELSSLRPQNSKCTLRSVPHKDKNK